MSWIHGVFLSIISTVSFLGRISLFSDYWECITGRPVAEVKKKMANNIRIKTSGGGALIPMASLQRLSEQVRHVPVPPWP